MNFYHSSLFGIVKANTTRVGILSAVGVGVCLCVCVRLCVCVCLSCADQAGGLRCCTQVRSAPATNCRKPWGWSRRKWCAESLLATPEHLNQ